MITRRDNKIPAVAKLGLAGARDRLIAVGGATGNGQEPIAWKVARAKLEAARTGVVKK